MGGFSTLGGGISWEEIKQKLESEGAMNKQYDSDVDGVIDLGAIPTIPRSKLEYPTEDVSFAYLAIIDKFKPYDNSGEYSIRSATVDSFTDKAIRFNVSAQWALCPFRIDGWDFYMSFQNTGASTADAKLCKYIGGTLTDLATESVDLSSDSTYYYMVSVSGSTLKLFRNDLTTAKISATDTDLASGLFGTNNMYGSAGHEPPDLSARLLAPASPSPRVKSILEVDELRQNLVPISKVNVPDFLKANAKKYEILKAKGFTDDEIRELFGNIQTHVDLASVTWGAFDHKPEHNTMLITITAGNPYTGEKAITEQIEHAKSKNLKVLKPPRDYSEAVEQYRQLKQEFTEWIAGKDNFAYQTLGHEDFEKFQVADTYHGNIVEGYNPDAYKNVPDWEMRRTLAMWKERLKRAEVVKSEAEKHLKKLEEVEKKGW